MAQFPGTWLLDVVGGCWIFPSPVISRLGLRRHDIMSQELTGVDRSRVVTGSGGSGVEHEKIDFGDACLEEAGAGGVSRTGKNDNTCMVNTSFTSHL